MPTIITLDRLTNEAVNELLEGKALAVRIPHFVPDRTCELLSQWLKKHTEQVNYTHELYVDGEPKLFDYGVTRIGTPYNLTYGKSRGGEEAKKYYSDALRFMHDVREACDGYLAPIDKLRLELDEVFGAQLGRFDGMPMFAGIGRITRPNATRLAEQPHFDSLPEKYNLDAQFGANTYLEMPDSGGELELWEHEPLTPFQISKANPETDWRGILGKPVLIKPEIGELILLNTRRGHAVREYNNEGVRISASCFIGYKKGEPLKLWS